MNRMSRVWLITGASRGFGAEIAKAAQQLDVLTHSLEQATPQINAAVERAGLQSKELVDYAFRRALVLLVLTLVGVLLAMLLYRWFALRRARDGQ